MGIGEHERLLRQALSDALEELKPVTPDEPPLVLLLDGGDELLGLWHTSQHRQDFPACLPTELPPGTFIVLLSRPGDFLPPDQKQKRLNRYLHYRFGPGGLTPPSEAISITWPVTPTL